MPLAPMEPHTKSPFMLGSIPKRRLCAPRLRYANATALSMESTPSQVRPLLTNGSVSACSPCVPHLRVRVPHPSKGGWVAPPMREWHHPHEGWNPPKAHTRNAARIDGSITGGPAPSRRRAKLPLFMLYPCELLHLQSGRPHGH